MKLIKDENINILDLIIFILQMASIITGMVLFAINNEAKYLYIILIGLTCQLYWAIRSIYCKQ